jgi:hypothetical protein
MDETKKFVIGLRNGLLISIPLWVIIILVIRELIH